MARKKFETPPVKLACLACRASRTRCDGDEPCHNCSSRGRECSYVPSKRGGSRKRRADMSQVGTPVAQVPSPMPWRLTDDLSSIDQIGRLIAPGSGLKQTVVVQNYEQTDRESSSGSIIGPIENKVVRIYASASAVLNAYYIFIHPYFTILAPPLIPLELDYPTFWHSSKAPKASRMFPFNSNSPLCLAMSAILALLPPQEQGQKDAAASLTARRSLAQHFARAAMERIEEDAEIINATTVYNSQSPTLQWQIDRQPFHPLTPVELESTLALLVLSNYEHTQRGNLLNMASRAGQALITAKSLSLHRLTGDVDQFSEARRRTWWMTYFCAHLCSIVRQRVAISMDDDSSITTPFPRLESDPEVWAIFIEALRVSVASVQLIASYRTPHADQSNIDDKLQKLDKWLLQTTAKAEAAPAGASPLSAESYEEYTATVMRRLSRIRLSSARIRIHRYQAFADIPLFFSNHCDLAEAKSFEYLHDSDGNDMSNLNTALTCEQAAAICVESALAAARQLRSLQVADPLNANKMLPRTMPTCSCCAMQAAYTMLMQLYKLHAMNLSGPATARSAISTERLVEELRHGIDGVTDALKDFAASFEAIDGMRAEIVAAVQVAFQNGII